MLMTWGDVWGGTGCGFMHVLCPGSIYVQRPGWGVAVCGSCSVLGLRWWAVRVRLEGFPTLVPDCLCMPHHHFFL